MADQPQHPAARLVTLVNAVAVCERTMASMVDFPLSDVIDIERFKVLLFDEVVRTYQDVLPPETIAAAVDFYEGPGREMVAKQAVLNELLEKRVAEIVGRCLLTE